MSGTLYLCATPIGNLEDMTYRAVRVLSEVDLIAAEDTRNSIKLLNHFQIKTPMTSYHEHNRREKGIKLVEQLREGISIALITDAGMPAISDPGEDLVRQCHEEGIAVTALPGASACVTALALSGLPTKRFSFEGFLPNDNKKNRQLLEELKNETRTIILYESPHRLKQTIKVLEEYLGNRKITICRELTKRYETILQSTLQEAALRYKEEVPRGEFVLIIEGKAQEEILEEVKQKWESMSIEEHMQYYEDEGMQKKDAMKAVAKDRGIRKNEVYKQLLE